MYLKQLWYVGYVSVSIGSCYVCCVSKTTLVCRVEDHDDLVPIFNQQSEMLSQTYGEYFLAELIEAQDDNMKCLVAEVGDLLSSSMFNIYIFFLLAFYAT